MWGGKLLSKHSVFFQNTQSSFKPLLFFQNIQSSNGLPSGGAADGIGYVDLCLCAGGAGRLGVYDCVGRLWVAEGRGALGGRCAGQCALLSAEQLKQGKHLCSGVGGVEWHVLGRRGGGALFRPLSKIFEVSKVSASTHEVFLRRAAFGAAFVKVQEDGLSLIHI